MKKQFNLIAVIVFLSQFTFAQSKEAEKFEIMVGGSFAKPKIIPKVDKLALAQITVNYKTITEARTIGNEKKTGSKAGAKVAAYLEMTDGEMSENDFQEITDYFYSYFQKKLKSNGIDTVGWSTITATDFYKNASEKVAKDKGEKVGNAWVTSTAHRGNILHSGSIGFAFGKIKKASNFCEEIGAPAGFFSVTVDFADINVNVDIKTAGGSGYIPSSGYYYPALTKVKITWSVNSEMKVVPPATPLFSYFWNKKSQSESLILRGEIESGINYSDNIGEDVSKARTGLAKQFAFRREMTPVVIETTREKYKNAAKKALEKYADEFVLLSQK